MFSCIRRRFRLNCIVIHTNVNLSTGTKYPYFVPFLFHDAFADKAHCWPHQSLQINIFLYHVYLHKKSTYILVRTMRVFTETVTNKNTHFNIILHTDMHAELLKLRNIRETKAESIQRASML